MALGYLDLSNNPISLKALRSIARSHVLELVLGRDCKPNERRQILRMLPNVWVLDEEFVTEKERRDAESSQQRDKSGGNTKNAHDFLVSNDKTTAGPAEFDAARDSGVKKKHREISARGGNRAPHDMACSYSSHYRILERQSRRTQEFFKNVIWKIPSRWGQNGLCSMDYMLGHPLSRSAYDTSRSHASEGFEVVGLAYDCRVR